jgi:hypothetical protein
MLKRLIVRAMRLGTPIATTCSLPPLQEAHHRSQRMKKTVAMLAMLALSLPAAAQVQIGAGGKAGAGAGAGVGAGPAGAQAGGQADVRIGAGADARTENANTGGEQRGLERAQTRMSEEGKAHEKATVSPGKKKGPRAGASARAESSTEGSATTRQ